MKLVLIGSEGFIGQAFQRHCRAAGVDLVTIDSQPADRPHHQTVDIGSPELAACLPPDAQAVIHLAAISRDRDCARDPMAALQVNVAGTWNVLQCARARGIPQLIFASTEWVYGDVVLDDQVQDERMPIDVNRLSSPYALSKLFAERLLYAGWSADPATAVTILRFAIVYGPRPANWSAVEQLFHQVRDASVVEVGCLRTARRFIHVEDIACGILCTVGTSGYEVFNLSGSRLITLGEIIQTSGELLGRQPTVVETGRGGLSVRNPTHDKARRVLGWEPTIDLRAGLRSLLTPEAQLACR